MQKLRFSDLPLLVQFTSLATLFIGWIMIAEFIIDRHGYDRFLPFYRVGNICLYDVGILLALAVAWALLGRRRGR